MAPFKVCLLATGLLTAQVATAQLSGSPASLPIRVLAPRAGTLLVGGSQTELAWEPSPGGSLPAGDEWEAFVSLDGGRTYTVRITPHLDRSVRRIAWTVPEAQSGDVRLLLRFGDERRETVVEIPTRYRIAGIRAVDTAILRVAARGESARPREAAVAVWVEGNRSGGQQRRVMSLDSSVRPGADSEDRANPSPPIAWSPRSSPLLPPSAAIQSTSSESPPDENNSPRRPGETIDRLLQTSRRNE